jgi:hypothetical protein
MVSERRINASIVDKATWDGGRLDQRGLQVRGRRYAIDETPRQPNLDTYRRILE